MSSDRSQNTMRCEKAGYGFERSVYKFASCLDPNAEVLFDQKMPDKDTGTLRQCDVWINAKLGGHWPISILVSCKDKNRKLHVGDIGNFCDEVRSTSASTGIIYARNGFTEPAIKKAKANGIACCRLYVNEPGELPASIQVQCYLSNPCIDIQINNLNGVPIPLPFRIIFDIPVVLPKGDSGTVIDLILLQFDEYLRKSAEATITSCTFPKAWGSFISLDQGNNGFSCNIDIYGSWKHYQGISKATLLNGSYCVTNDSYVGWHITPEFHQYDAHPGQDWVRIEGDTVLPKRVIHIILGRDIRELIKSHFGPLIAMPIYN